LLTSSLPKRISNQLLSHKRIELRSTKTKQNIIMRFSSLLVAAATMVGSTTAMFPVKLEDRKNKRSGKSIVHHLRENRHLLKKVQEAAQKRRVQEDGPIEFDPPIAFAQYMGGDGCDPADEVASGTIDSLEVLEEDGAFCLVTGDVYTKYVIDECISEPLPGSLETYYDCADSSCSSGCEKTLISFGPAYGIDTPIDSCFTFLFSEEVDDFMSLQDEDEQIIIQTQFTIDGDDLEAVTPFVEYYGTIYQNSCLGTTEFEETLAPDAADEGDGVTLEEAVEEVVTEAIEGDSCLSIVDAACSDENFSVLCELLEGNDELVSLFTDAEDGFTFFAPIDAAFEEVSALFEAASPEEAESILAFHLVLGSITGYDALECTVTTEMANGSPSRTKCEREDGLIVGKYQKGGGNRKNDNLPLIILPDNLVCNGIIHAIDAVMLPNAVPEIPGLFD